MSVTDSKYDVINARKNNIAQKIGDFSAAIKEESTLLEAIIKKNPHDVYGIKMRSLSILQTADAIRALSSALGALHDVPYLMEGSEKP